MSDTRTLILVVDDNEMNRDMLSRRLQRQDYEVLVAEDGEKALAIVKERPFDLVLLDIMMPNLSGYEVLEQLKADIETQHIPVIMISAVDDLDSVVRCIELGAEDYLFKPFNPVLLKARVGSSLRKSRSIQGQQIRKALETIQAAIDNMSADNPGSTQHQQLEQIQSSLNSITALIGVDID
jgi:DNA-binding response OmpR family regulator